MKKVLFFAPKFGNGGIVSWATKFVATFPKDEFDIILVSSNYKSKNMSANLIMRVLVGIKELFVCISQLIKVLKTTDIDILHTTTSGKIGSFRDCVVGLVCRHYGVKSILHCHYGCIPQILDSNSLIKKILLHSLKYYNQIWVLDENTFNRLSVIESRTWEVCLTPNSIVVPPIESIAPKLYKEFAFIANVLPTKGIFELLEAFKSGPDGTYLHIIGPSSADVKQRMASISGLLWGDKIKYHGKLSNDEVIQFMSNIDVLVLPTYFEGEAFPISILEAMSQGKLVISTPRAAISDMLTAVDGSQCGILVKEKDVQSLTDAIFFCVNNTSKADEMCRKAYEKVYTAYRTEVVYETYKTLYRKLI